MRHASCHKASAVQPPLLRRGCPVVQRHHLSSSASCRGLVAAAAAAREPGSREREGAGAAGSSGGSGSSSNENAVPAVLPSAALSPAELQRQAPAAYRRLSLALAQVLAEVRADWAARGRGTRVPAAELLARIGFLAWEVGLTAAEIRDGHRRDWRSLFFTLDGARRLHSWLTLQQLSTEQLRLASRKYTTLWAADVLRVQRCKEYVQQHLSATDSQWRKAFTTIPLAVLAPPERVAGVVAWLEAQPLGLTRAEVTRLWLSLPGLFGVSADVLQHRLRQLVSRFSLDEISMRRIVRRNPSLLIRSSATLLGTVDSLLAAEPCLRASFPLLLCNGGSALSHSSEALLSKIKFLRDYGFVDEQLAKVLSSQMTLSSSLEDKIKPNLAALQSVLGSQERVVAVLTKNPNLLGSAVDTIEGNVEVMQELGLSPADIRESVGRRPQLFACDYSHEDFQAKLRYFEAVLGRSPRHMLLHHPWALMYALNRVDYRVSFIQHKEDAHHKATITWISWTTEQFCECYGYSVAEFEGWGAQWVLSDRARQYGLDKTKVPGMARAQQARERRGRAKVAARRGRVLAAGEE